MSQSQWFIPIPFAMQPTSESLSFQEMPYGVTGIPLPPHPGAFGVKRKFHTHEGIDLYCPISTPVQAVEPGEVVAVIPFTGPSAGPSLAHWMDTKAVFVEGPSGVVVYGEIAPHVKLGAKVSAGEILGVVVRVLRHDKGRPTSMLHLELHTHGSRTAPEWLIHEERPPMLLDPTPFLLNAREFEIQDT